MCLFEILIDIKNVGPLCDGVPGGPRSLTAPRPLSESVGIAPSNYKVWVADSRQLSMSLFFSAAAPLVSPTSLSFCLSTLRYDLRGIRRHLLDKQRICVCDAFREIFQWRHQHLWLMFFEVGGGLTISIGILPLMGHSCSKLLDRNFFLEKVTGPSWVTFTWDFLCMWTFFLFYFWQDFYFWEYFQMKWAPVT